MKKILDSLDHPVPFILFTTLAVCGMASILTWGFKAAGLSGAAAVTEH